MSPFYNWLVTCDTCHRFDSGYHPARSDSNHYGLRVLLIHSWSSKVELQHVATQAYRLILAATRLLVIQITKGCGFYSLHSWSSKA